MAEVLDLSLIRPPESIWAEPEDCPDYPLAVLNEKPLRASREDAEGRLAWLLGEMHPLGAILRPPTPDEAEAALAEHFKPTEKGESSGVIRRFERLGFPGLRHKIDSRGVQIVEAVHVRGYLRKLDKEAEARVVDDAAEARRPHQRVVESYLRSHATDSDALLSLAEGYGRHAQWLLDKRAFEQAVDLRASIGRRRVEAERAARAIGETLPPLQDFGAVGDPEPLAARNVLATDTPSRPGVTM